MMSVPWEDQTEYAGLWHVDGDLENVAAVVLYYYHKDEALLGGAMEFADRGPMDVLGAGDCSNNIDEFGVASMRRTLRGDRAGGGIPSCKAEIEEGTLTPPTPQPEANEKRGLENS